MENLATIHQVTIPPLRCSLPLICHPNYEEIRNVSDSWFMSHFKPPTQEERKLVIQSQYPLFASLTYTNVQHKRLLPIVKFLSWAFVFDDIKDDLDNVGCNASAAEEIFQGLSIALELKKPEPSLKIVSTALDWWTTISKDLTIKQQSRFIQVVRDTFDASKSEISYRESQSIPDVQSYIRMRRNTSTLMPCFILLEYGLGMELDEESLKSPLILKLHDAAIDHISWVNDLLSLRGEYARGEFDNLPSVVYFNESLDFQESIFRVCRLIEQRDEDFVRLVNEFKKSDLMRKPDLQKYIQGLGNWMAGNLYWAYITARYHCVDIKPSSPNLPLPILLCPKEKML